ncbi:MAG: hypothetical protein Q9212_003010 [Teloschistes hypoglaucus]
MSLWEEARDAFDRQLRNQKVDGQSIDQFLQDRATPEDTRRSARALQTDGDRKIPSQWIVRIMDNIDKFVLIGDLAVKQVPKTIGLAWFATKPLLNALQSNYRLYTSFRNALSNITEMMVLIRTYDNLYKQRKTTGWKLSDMASELFLQIRHVYVAILDFSYSVRIHIKAGRLAEIGHAIKGIISAKLPEFQEKMNAIQTFMHRLIICLGRFWSGDENDKRREQ